jgi:hypothetical protein
LRHTLEMTVTRPLLKLNRAGPVVSLNLYSVGGRLSPKLTMIYYITFVHFLIN